jgi:hypothetical protein
LAQVRQTFRKISEDFSGHFAAESTRAQNSRHGNASE